MSIAVEELNLTTQSEPKPRKWPVNLDRVAGEPVLDRWVYGVFALALIAAYFLAMHNFWAPAHPGTDQNGYLVGGKLLEQTGSSGFVPPDPYSFVGRMWIENDHGKYFPKYPLGMSVIYAATLRFGGAKHRLAATFMISPIAMALAMSAVFLLVRLAAGSWAALLALLMIASSPVTLGLTNNPNSHAAAICVVSWGMYFLIRWWHRGGIAPAVGAGLLLGFAVTIRYTEGLLLLPIVLVVLLRCVWRDWRSVLETLCLTGAWLLPVVILIFYNLLSFHHLTGYDPTNESTGFSWENFQRNWETMLRQLTNTGLFFVLPFAIVGLSMMWRWNWKFTAVLWACILPNLILYGAYYWAPDGTTIAYLRFFLTIFPALALATAWCLKKLVELAAREGSRIMPRFGVLLVLAIGCGVNLNSALAELENDSQSNTVLYVSGRQIVRLCPKNSVIFAVGQDRLINYLQLVGDYTLYDAQQFNRAGVQRLANIDPNQPNGLQPQRAKEMYDRLSKLSEDVLTNIGVGIIQSALRAGRHVYLIAPKSNPGLISRFLPRQTFSSRVVGEWEEPPTDLRAQRRQRWQGFTLPRWLNVNEPSPAPVMVIWEATFAPPPVVHRAKPVKARGTTMATTVSTTAPAK